MDNPCKKLLLLFSVFLATAAFAADTITGTVRNQTSGRPAMGDDVVLLRLGEGMQEEARTKTDAQGAFTLNVSFPKDQHVIQVRHQGVDYDQPVSGTGSVDISVYDAVRKIPGLQGPLGIAQMESDGKVLKVTEMYDIANTSNPPVTQSRPDNFVITVPPNAAFDSVQVRRGQGIWLKVAPVPVKGQSGKYAINFPIRPGDTLFKFVYHVESQGPTTFHIRLPYPIQRFGVMHPPSMVFKPSQPKAFRSPPQLADGLKVEAAVAMPSIGEVPAFQISGIGTRPEHGTGTATASPAPEVSAPPGNVHTAPVNPPSPAEQSRKQLGILIAAIITILAVGAFTFWRLRRRPDAATAGAKPGSGKPLLDALKEELFQLESERLHGSISAEDYATTKQALTRSIERATAKKQ